MPIPGALLALLEFREFGWLEPIDFPWPDAEFGRSLVYPSVELPQRDEGYPACLIGLIGVASPLEFGSSPFPSSTSASASARSGV